MEHLSSETIERYRARSIPPGELLAADDHLAACEACRERLLEEKRFRDAFTFVREDLAAEDDRTDHPLYDELAGYLDGELGDVDREIVQSHLEGCASCEAELQDLKAFKASLEKERAQRVGWPGFWRQPRRFLPLLAAAAFVLFALGIGIVNWALRSQIAGLRAELAELETENARMERDYDAARSQVAELEAQLAGLQGSPTPDGSGPSSILLALNDGGSRVTLDREGHLAGLERLEPEHRRAIAAALRNQRLETPPLLAALIGRPGVLLGGSQGAAFELLAPVGTVVTEERPTFRWKALRGADSYTVSVHDSDFNQAVGSPPLSATEWTSPRPLRRGAVYSWQVTARKDGAEILTPTPPAPEAKFKVLELEKAAELERAKRDFTGSRLLGAVLYARAGVLDEAERELEALLGANPNSPVVRKLLNELRALRRT